MYRSKLFEQVLNEGYFDVYQDRPTRRLLLSIEEADQDQVLTSLTHKLYDKIVAKSTDIDYGQIPDSKGDITKIPNYEEIEEILTIIKGLLESYRQPVAPAAIVSDAINNLKIRKEDFERCFRYGIEFGMVLYNNIALSIVTSTSLLIRACIEFVKDPTDGSFRIALDRSSAAKSKDGLLFKNLEKFNNSCANKDIDKVLDHITKTVTRNFTGASVFGPVAGTIAVIGLIFCIIPLLRELIYYFYHFRVTISDNCEYQANLLKLNAYKLEADTERDPSEVKTIVKKQLKVAQTLEKIGNKISISDKKATVEAEKDIKKAEKEDKKMKLNTVVDTNNLTSAEPDKDTDISSDDKQSSLF